MKAAVFPRVLSLLTLSVATLVCSVTAGQAPVKLPDYPGQVMLIRNTLTAVNHGNLTGNYTVLRDLASVPFRRQNTAGDLAATFAALRKQKLDLSPVLVTEPTLTERPGMDQNNRMRLLGYIPTRPKAVRFSLIFQYAGGSWSIDEVSVAVVPTELVVQTQLPRPTALQDIRTPPTQSPLVYQRVPE